MLEAVLGKADTLARVIESVKQLVTDVEVRCSQDGMTVSSMDASHVALVDLRLGPSMFDLLRVDRSTVLGMNLPALLKIINCCRSGDPSLTLRKEDNSQQLSLLFESADQKTLSHFNLKLFDFDVESISIPEQRYDAVVHMPSSELKRTIKELHAIGDTVTISVLKEGLRFFTDGNMASGTVTYPWSDSKDPEKNVCVDAGFKGLDLRLSLRYLMSFMEGAQLSSTVTLKMTDEVPFVVEYPIQSPADATVAGGRLSYYLAPKHEDETEAAGHPPPPPPLEQAD